MVLWHEAHIGVDDSSPIVHSVHTTAANEHDVTQAHHLLHGEEKRVFADAGYQGVEKRPEHEGRDTKWYIAMRPGARRALGDSEEDKTPRLQSTLNPNPSSCRTSLSGDQTTVRLSQSPIQRSGEKYEPPQHAVRKSNLTLSTATSKLICRIAPVVQKRTQKRH